jgi:hypothetical protein
MLLLIVPLLVLRPLLTAVIEYGLAWHVFRKGKFMPYYVTLFLIFLATYQFGEYMFLTGGNERLWLGISLFSTTMLPPYGLVFIEKLSGQKAFSALFFIASTILGLTFLLAPSVLPRAEECNCFLKYDSSSLDGRSANFYRAWWGYYLLSLTFSILLIAWHIVRRNGNTKSLKLILAGYISFFPSSFIIVNLFNLDLTLVSSVMCSLAILMAFIISYVSLKSDYKLNKTTDLLGITEEKHILKHSPSLK